MLDAGEGYFLLLVAMGNGYSHALTIAMQARLTQASGAVLGANAQTVLEHVGEGVIPLAVVKGNGYGHGLTVAAQVFLDSGFKELGVADLNEAITLRQVREGRGPALCPAAHARTQ